MSRKSSTTIAVAVRMRLPPGVSQKAALNWLKNAILYQKNATNKQSPLAAMPIEEFNYSVISRETRYF